MARSERPVGTIAATIRCCGLKEYNGLNSGDNWTVERFFDALRQSCRSTSWRWRAGIVMFTHKKPKPSFDVGGIMHRPNSIVSQEFKYFTPTGQSKKLNKLKRYIHTHNLGVLRIGQPVNNPNSNNMLVPAMWEVNSPALLRHLKATNPNRRGEVDFTVPRV